MIYYNEEAEKYPYNYGKFDPRPLNLKVYTQARDGLNFNRLEMHWKFQNC